MADGSLIERDVLNVVEKIREYDSNLRVKYVDPARAEFGDAPYKVTEICRDGIERVVFSVWKLDETILDRLRAADTAVNNVLLSVDNTNLLAEKQENQRYKEQMGEAKDILISYLSSPKQRWSFKDPVTENKVMIDSSEGSRPKVERSGFSE